MVEVMMPSVSVKQWSVSWSAAGVDAEASVWVAIEVVVAGIQL
jgi:hypothetical protein